MKLFYSDMSFTVFWDDLISIFKLEGSSTGYKDPFIHILSFLLGSVLQLPGLYFVIVAAIYGYFFSKSVFLILHKPGILRKNYLLIGFVVVFLLIRNLEGLQAVRMWTGMWVLFYASLQYIETKKVKYFILLFGAPFIHLGFLPILVVVLPTLLFPFLNTRLIAALFVLSSFMNTGPIADQIKQNVSSPTTLAENWGRGYEVKKRLNFQDKLDIQSNTSFNWYKKYISLGIHQWTLNIFIYGLLLFKIFPNRMDRTQVKLFSVGLAVLILANLTWFNSALSGRSQQIGMLFVMAAFILVIQESRFLYGFWTHKPLFRMLCSFCFLFWLPFILFKLSTNLDNLSMYSLILPPVVWFDAELNYSAKELFRYILFFFL